MINIYKLINQPVTSNCYIITYKSSQSCIIVDPGTSDCYELKKFLQTKKLFPDLVVLTHEHIDHVIGIKDLLKHYNTSLLCSFDCNRNLNSSKYNLTRYSEQFEEITNLPTADILLENIDYSFKWKDYTIQFHKAEGHSAGSVFFNIANNLFIGDTLLKGYRTTTILPGASKEMLIGTFEKMLLLYNTNQTLVYPGHGADFLLSELEYNIKEQIVFLEKKHLKQKSIK